MSERLTGTCLWFDDLKGYGFLLSEAGERYFVHYRHIVGPQGQRTLNPNEKVTFDLAEDETGRTYSTNVIVSEMISGGNRD